MSKIQGWIYKITNVANGKVYVGQTSNLRKRLSKHKCELRKGKHSNKHLQASWNIYGESSFLFEVIETIDSDMNFDIDNLERYWIKELSSMNPVKGYNIESGGNKNKTISNERRLRQSELMKGRKSWNKGLRGVQSAWNKGIAWSSEAKKNLSTGQKNYYKNNPGNKTGYSKFKVILTNLETSEKLIFDSVYKCAEAIGSSYSTIKNHIKRNAKTIMKKYQIRNLITSEVSH